MKYNTGYLNFRHLILFLCFTILVTLALGGCATMDSILKKPSATFDSMQVTSADLLGASTVFNFNVSNPNPISIPASSITYDIKLNGRDFIAGQLDRGITLAANGTSRLSIPVTMQYLEFFESLTQMWQSKGADYALTGGFSVGPFRIPYQARGHLDLPKMPRFSLENIRIENLSMAGARLNGQLKMDNPNAFKMLFKRLEYDLNLGSTSFARASALPDGPISGHGKSMVNLAFDVSFAELGMSAYQLLSGKKSLFKLDGGMVIDSPTGGEQIVPFKLTGQVPFVR